MNHIFETHKDCHKPYCSICDGGLAVCTICGLAEGSLTTECPGVASEKEYGDEVYEGRLDFRDGKWTNRAAQSWRAA